MSVRVEGGLGMSQRLDALERANGVRFAKAAFKAELAQDPQAFQRAAAVLDDPQGWEGALQVAEVLLCLPHVGHVKAERWAKKCDVGLHRKLRDLPLGKRRRLSWFLLAQDARDRRRAA